MDPITIVRIIARLNIGGPAVNAATLSAGLDTKKFRTVLVYGSLAEGEGSLEHLVRDRGVDIRVVAELGREISPFDDLKALLRIMEIIRKERPAIVHTHTAKAGTLGRLAAFLCGVRIKIHTFHGHVFRHYFGRLKTAVFIMIERFLGLVTDRVVVISERQKEDISRVFRIVPERKCAVIPLGLNLAPFTAVPPARTIREELKLPAGAILVGMIGRIVPIKNHEMLLQSLAAAAKKRPDLDIRCVIVGEGELGGRVRQRAHELGLADRVLFAGWRPDLTPVLAGLDIVALTSMNEGTPLALIEAMAAGKAIVATAVGGVPDIIEDRTNGFLVASNDIEAFTDRLIALAVDPALRERFGTVGRKMSGRFAKDRLVAETADFYMACLKEKGMV